MEQDSINALKDEIVKEKAICNQANASEVHRKRLGDLCKELEGAEKNAQPKMKPHVETVEPTPKETTNSTADVQETTTVSTNEEPEKQG
jgi:predicted transposase YdaD